MLYEIDQNQEQTQFWIIDFEIGAHTGAKKEFLQTICAPFYGAPSVYALVSIMTARIAYRITADTYLAFQNFGLCPKVHTKLLKIKFKPDTKN